METGVSTWIPGVGGEPLDHSLDIQKWQKERKRSKWRAKVHSMHLIFPAPLEEQKVPVSRHVCSSPQKGPSTLVAQ